MFLIGIKNILLKRRDYRGISEQNQGRSRCCDQ